MSASIYWRKLEPPVTVSEHLQDVADLAREYADASGLGQEAHIAGLFHDFGQYSTPSQKVLGQERSKVDHAIPGAALLQGNRALAEAVAGHHEGLKSLEQLYPLLKNIFGKTTRRRITMEGKEVSLWGMEDMKAAWQEFEQDHPDCRMPETGNPGPGNTYGSKLDYMLRVRMLYSALVDAEFTMADSYKSDLDVKATYGRKFDPEAALAKLETECGKIRVSGGDAIRRDGFLYSMTGYSRRAALGNAMRLAMDRCIADRSRKRVIFVLPEGAFCEELERFCQKAIPDTLVDDGQYREPVLKRDLDAWDAGCIITTMDRFFRYIWSYRPDDCRRLHRLADSVLVLDGLELIPKAIARVAAKTLLQLTKYHTCILSVGAIPLGWGLLPGITWKPEQIGNRKTEIGMDYAGKLSITEAADHAAGLPDVCVIMEKPKEARLVYAEWEKTGIGDIFLLSPDQCPRHQKRIIKEIQERQEQGEPVRVATVWGMLPNLPGPFFDILCPLAPIPLLARLESKCPATMFCPKGDWLQTEETQDIWQILSSGADMFTEGHLSGYYRSIYQGYKDPAGLKRAAEGLDYEGFSKETDIGKKPSCQVAVPYEKERYGALLHAMEMDTVTEELVRGLSPILVGAQSQAQIEPYCEKVQIQKEKYGGGTYLQDTGIWVLLPEYKTCYDDRKGLDFGSM